MIEEWRDVQGYEGLYQISNTGKVKSYHQSIGRILRPGRQKKGYLTINLSKKGQHTSFLVARLVALAFLANPHNLPQVNHKNGDKNNNRIDNLEWISNADNMRHSYQVLNRKGQICIVNGRSRLTEKEILEIRSLYKTGKFLQKDLAIKFGVIQCHISRIILNTAWSHIE